jgi:Cu(I)/Ag(I) efflux system membrane fusion protein
LETLTTDGETIASNEIVLSAEAIQLANIQTSIAVRSSAKKEVRLLGTVKPDERRQYSQVSHIPGRIEKLYLNFTGEKVKKGQRIVRIYSPELISAQKELFEAIKSRDIYPQLFKASRNKLKLWKLTDTQIEAIINSGEVQEQIDILSDYSGYVMKRYVDLGDHVMEGMKLFDIANIDNVWVMFQAYEVDIPWINRGDIVEFTLQAIPGKTYKGKVTYIDPFVSSDTRVAKVRVEVKNRNHKLLPEMFANGIIEANLSDAKDALIIPKSAVLWTGKRSVVYVKVPHDRTISFVYREIILGADLGDFYIIEKGLEAGEEIATNGVFRIDASAQLLGQKSMMNPSADGGKVSTGSHAGMDMSADSDRNENKLDTDKKQGSKNETGNKSGVDKEQIDKKFKHQLGNVISAYIILKDALTNDDPIEAQKQPKNITKALKEVDMLLLSGVAHKVWMEELKTINASIEAIQSTKNIESQRKAFVELSQKLSDVVNDFGIITMNRKPLYLEFCPMANNDKGAYWLSYDKEIKNPYFGEQMLSCGEIIKTF